MPFTISIELACCDATNANGGTCTSSGGAAWASSDADQAHAAVSTAAADDGASTEPPSANEEQKSSCTCASSLTAECARSSFGDAADKHVPFMVSAERMCLTYEHTMSSASDDPAPTMVGVFVPSFLVEGSAASKCRDQSCNHLLENNPIIISEDMLPQIHASLSGLAIRGIISTRRRSDDTARNDNAIDLVLIELPQREGLDPLSVLMDEVHNQAMDRAYNSVIKILPLSMSSISFSPGDRDRSSKQSQSTFAHDDDDDSLEIPSCPVCLHRIDPRRLGWPRPRSHEVCSQFCSSRDVGSCPNMRFLTPWQDPSSCRACRVIWEQWKPPSDGKGGGGPLLIEADASAHRGCYRCGMDQTLWVCLTCGVIGCGRYSQGHAKQHNDETGHPYSLELVTQRIWDYSAAGWGEFVQRSDLLNCSSMQLRLGKGHGSSNNATPDPPYPRADSLPPRKDEEGFPIMEDLDLANPNGSFLAGDGGEWAEGAPSSSCGRLGSFRQHYDPSPKKATMVGEEYEALLQSALDDQAQHYEGEITALIAALTAQRVDYEKMTEDEASQVEGLRKDIALLRREADQLSRELLDAQSEEAGLRASSQKLLREQSVSKGLLEKIKEEGKAEQDEAKAQVEELEQQVVDLTANIRMRDQIKADGELSEAQIFGTTSVPSKSGGRSGKKGRKGGRRSS